MLQILACQSGDAGRKGNSARGDKGKRKSKNIQGKKKKLKQIKPDFVLIDTPPSVTNVHIELLSRVKVSYILFVTQPTKLSNQDVLRTMDFFHEKCGRVNCGVVENMCYDNEKREYPIKLVA